MQTQLVKSYAVAVTISALPFALACWSKGLAIALLAFGPAWIGATIMLFLALNIINENDK